ncbi:helix-turn-helix transcriptional regulator [uncultured Roseovarius sp.]|uniref:helix-turn-helix domain-containing protein n=1 Tax=uncultured Roseovarius sp. TaxID=293344 RepID=UPI0026222DA9|nr:helix-turn-helix transcriptional regulator [uncultured Roseovarius sp.]
MGQLIDTHVGNRIHLRRLLLGVSELSLGRVIGCTVLQIKRYELGLDRIEASKLFEMADALDVPVTYFFEGLKALSMKLNSEEENYEFEDDATELIAAYHGKTTEERVDVFEHVVARGRPDPDKLN